MKIKTSIFHLNSRKPTIEFQIFLLCDFLEVKMEIKTHTI